MINFLKSKRAFLNSKIFILRTPSYNVSYEKIVELINEEEARFNTIYKKIMQTFNRLVETHGKTIAPVYFNNFLNFAWDANSLKLQSISQSLKLIKAQLDSYLVIWPLKIFSPNLSI